MTDGSKIARARKELVRRYCVPANAVRVVLAPYRICPLGAHIDHQLGCVTAMAIDRGVTVAYASSESERTRLSSLDFPGEVDFSLSDVPNRRGDEWGNYVRGAVRALQKRHRLTRGIIGVTAGSISGGGLSSSAAIGVALLMAVEDVNDLALSVEENIALDLAIENEYLGLRNGILDQAAILLSRRDQLTFVDCRTLEHRLIPFPQSAEPAAVLVAFSGLQRSLVGTDYNRRVAECARAARELLRAAGRDEEPSVLGRVEASEYEAHKSCLSGAPARRARHFFTEMQRVAEGVAAWQRGDLAALGQLINASGESSIVNYQCGCPPLVDLYEILVDTPGVYGARFSGAGFRGCCMALIAPEAGDAAAQAVRRAYAAKYPDLARRADVLLCTSDDGARFVEDGAD
jgi:galacturonokinase